MLRAAQAGGYAVGAFNVENMEMAQAVVAAAEKLRSPAIVQTTAGTLRYAPPELFAATVERLARNCSSAIAMHLDHGDAYELALDCARAGYTSVMMDGSSLPYNDNIEITHRVADAMRGYGIPVEGELGAVGGKEDARSADKAAEPAARYTDPDQAAEFALRTGVSSLAIAIGTAHGLYKSAPKLDLDRLSAIRARVSAPLVLHGTTGVSYAVVRECIARGICKVNVATDLRVVFTQAVRDALAASPEAIDPKAYLKYGRAAVQARVEEWILAVGSENKSI
jgi:tagatose 1,6-diphosphate aldolase GatY/KbaY